MAERSNGLRVVWGTVAAPFKSGIPKFSTMAQFSFSLDIYVGGIVVTTYKYYNGYVKLSERVNTDDLSLSEYRENLDAIAQWFRLLRQATDLLEGQKRGKFTEEFKKKIRSRTRALIPKPR
jgi:hypothetical protein